MRRPCVSVITIFFNEERFIAEAVDSVLSQSFRDWELLLVDDGSVDHSSAIAQHYAQAYPGRIRYLWHPGRINRGMSESRNLGIAQASGDFIAFLDADDVWLPNKLAEQVAVMGREPEADLLYGQTLIWHSWDKGSVSEDFFYGLGVIPDHLYRPPQLFEILLENRAQTPTTCNAIMRRALFDKIGGFERSFRGMFEDQVFFSKAFLTAPAYVDNKVWARYRQHRQSCTAIFDPSGDDPLVRLRFLRWLIAYLNKTTPLDHRLRGMVEADLGRCRTAIAKNLLRRAKSTLKRLMFD